MTFIQRGVIYDISSTGDYNMRYLSTLLLTTTVLTTAPSPTHAAAAALDAPTTAPSITAISVSTAPEAAINKLQSLLKRNFSVSMATELLFSSDLYPLISWRSASKDPSIVEKIEVITCDAARVNLLREHAMIRYVALSILYPDVLETRPALSGKSILSELIDATLTWGQLEELCSNFYLTFDPLLRLKIYLELSHQSNITSDNLGYVLDTSEKLGKALIERARKEIDWAVEGFKREFADALSPEHSRQYNPSKLGYPGDRGRSFKEPVRTITIESASKALSEGEVFLDESFAAVSATTDRILANSGSTALNLLKEIFEYIANHERTSPKNKARALELLKIYSSSSATEVATDS